MQQTGKCTLVYWCGSTLASPGGKLSSVARLMRNVDTNRFRIRFVKKVLLETLYVLIYRCPISESVAVPHPPLRGTFPPGEGICRPNYRFPICCFKPIPRLPIYRYAAFSLDQPLRPIARAGGGQKKILFLQIGS